MNSFLQLTAIVSSLQYGCVLVNGNYVLTSSCGGVVTEGSSCVLSCETGYVKETPIEWKKGTSASYEVDRASCTTSKPEVPSDYVLACPGTNYTLTIKTASVTRDVTTWKCDNILGGKESNAINLLAQVNGNYVLTSSCGGVVTEGSSCVLSCETGYVMETPIEWKKGTSASYEVDRASCTTSKPEVPSDYVLACPGTNYTLTIKTASVTRDVTTWKCDAILGGKESNAINLLAQGSSTTPPAQSLELLSCLLILIPIIIVIVFIVYKKKKKNNTSQHNQSFSTF